MNRSPSLNAGAHSDSARPPSAGTLNESGGSDVEKRPVEVEKKGGFRNLQAQEDAKAAQTVDPYAPTDGGLQAWLSVGGGFLVTFSAFGIVSSYGAFSDFYNTDYLTHFSPTVISMIGAIQIFLFYLFSGLSGTLFDAYGPRVLIPVSGIICVFAMFMLSITKPEQIYQQYLSQGVLYPIGASLGFFPAANVITHWFRRRVAYALGCVIAGSGVGGIVFPIMLTRLIPRIGFGWSVRIIAFIMLFCYAVASVTITARRPRKPLPPLWKMVDFDGFRDLRYTFLVIAVFFNIIAIFNPFFYVGLYGLTLHPESTLLPYALSILNACSVLGRIFPALLADKLGRFNVISVFTLISALLNLAMWYNVTGEGVTVAFAALYGFFSGSYFSIIPACITMISPIDKIGARIGTLFMFMSFGALAGTPIGGVFIRERTKDHFQHLIAFSGSIGLLAAVFFFAARFAYSKQLLAIV